MDYGWVRNVCVISSVHALLQYLLLVSDEDVKTTFFFVGDGLPPAIVDKIRHQCEEIEKNPRRNSRIKLLIQFPFLRKKGIRYYGFDHLKYAKYIYGKNEFELLEDGTLNYVPYPYRSKPNLEKRIRQLIWSPLCCMDVPFAGYESTCKKIHLTGLSPTGEVYSSPKLSLRSFSDLWHSADAEKRDLVNAVFGMDESWSLRLQSVRKIVLTQPLSEDGFLSEAEKLSIYSKILEAIGNEDVVIKPHPRETTDYKRIFPNVPILDLPVPMQLFALNNIRFEEAYTLFSSSVFGFPYPIKVGYFGSSVSHKLAKRFPNLTREKCDISNEFVSLVPVDLDGSFD